jgi:hypothetical protein
MRQFYLLLAEHYAQQRAEDARCYRLMCCWISEPPAFEKLFPLWGDEEYDEDVDGESSFRAVTAALSQYRE